MQNENQTYINKSIPTYKTKVLNQFLSYKNKEIIENSTLSKDELLDVEFFGLSFIPYYNSTYNPPYYQSIEGSLPKIYLRRKIVEKLIYANSLLSKYGVELLILDGYRNCKVQSFLYDWYKSQSILEKNIELLISKPNTSNSNPSPHSTGGAVDLTLRFIDTQQQLFMGTIFDDSSDKAKTIFFEKKSQLSKLSESDYEALKNRRILYWSLYEVGLVNYPNEWWHFSYGDQVWAYLTNSTAAFYSKVKKPI